MARFKLFLIGSPQPLLVDLPVSGVMELNDHASRCRFITGNLSDPDNNGVCSGLMIPTSRIQLVVEADD